MNISGKTCLVWGIRIVLFAVFVFLCFHLFDMEKITKQILLLISHPFALLLMVGMYISAFLLRAFAWKKYLQNRVSMFVCLDGLFYSLLINHLLPFKVGDIVRAGFLVKERHISWEVAAHSVIVLRSLDVLILGCIAGTGTVLLGFDLSLRFMFVVLLVIGIASVAWMMLAKKSGIGFFQKHLGFMRQAMAGANGRTIVICTTLSWLLESFVLLGVVQSLSLDLSFLEGVWVTSMTISGQTFHFTPGGIGTYESVMSFSLAVLGMSLQNAYTVALLSHGFKFVFSFVVGIYVWLKSPMRWSEMMLWIGSKQRKERNSNE